MRHKGGPTQYIHKGVIKKMEAKQEQIKHNITAEARGHQNKTGRGTQTETQTWRLLLENRREERQKGKCTTDWGD